MLEYDLAGNAFRFILDINILMVDRGNQAQELVLEVTEKPAVDRLVIGIVMIQFLLKLA